jgi:hypothetical protein
LGSQLTRPLAPPTHTLHTQADPELSRAGVGSIGGAGEPDGRCAVQTCVRACACSPSAAPPSTPRTPPPPPPSPPPTVTRPEGFSLRAAAALDALHAEVSSAAADVLVRGGGEKEKGRRGGEGKHCDLPHNLASFPYPSPPSSFSLPSHTHTLILLTTAPRGPCKKTQSLPRNLLQSLPGISSIHFQHPLTY